MCNDYRTRVELDTIGQEFNQLRIPLRFPEGLPNLEPRDDVRITDRAPVIRAAAGEPGAELVTMRWSWPGPGGKPVYNFRSDGRRLDKGRCLIVADGFYESTDPEPSVKAGSKRKRKWLFTLTERPWFMIAGLWRQDPQFGAAFTMLTCPPGPDVAPYHNRQIVVLDRPDWSRWLDGSAPAGDLLQPLPAGALNVEEIPN